MNFLLLWINEKGERELATPPLDGTILPGVTRQSILDLCRSWGEFKVTERKIPMAAVLKAASEGRILEAFGAGTAAVVSPVKLIHFNGVDITVPLDPTNAAAGAGEGGREGGREGERGIGWLLTWRRGCPFSP